MTRLASSRSWSPRTTARLVYIDAAINFIKTNGCIATGAKHSGLDTVYDLGRADIIARIEREGQLWATVFRNEVSLGTGSRAGDQSQHTSIPVATELEAATCA